MDAIGVKPFRG